MKFNWGTGIAATYIIFALAMVGLVIKSTQHDVNLVKKEYYDDDINYQSHFNKLQNEKNLSTDLKIDLITKVSNPENSARVDLSLKFPAETPQPTGKITFFRPSKTGIDKTLDIQVNEKNEMIIPTSILKDGLWKVQVDWEANGKTFYKEQNILIGKV